ncbi:MAG: tetratricopeptide repeat protein [Allosphingosinicella sp.]|uniref:tetratricopeptide repeat protein n=1 Tax=Allosphingosinicella sp. TaxID=2823234 RepID=UPI0039375E9D
MISIIFAALAAAAAQPAEAGKERIFRAEGYVAALYGEEGRYVLELHDTAVRYALPRLDDKRLAAYADVIGSAHDLGVAIGVQFDGTAGSLTADGERIEFPLCTIEVDGAAIGSVAANCPPRRGAARAGERALALGLAQRLDRPDQAAALLATASRAADLPAAARAVALEKRGELLSYTAALLPRSDPGHDAKLLEAHADFQRLAKLQPGNAEAQRGLARTLTDLGAYEEALAIYARLTETEMDAFLSAISIGAIHRLRGDHAAALRALDALAESQGPMEGMRYHYHRGWTLRLLGRHEEAIESFSEGMRSQPDYAFAFLQRSCAFALLGRHREALADHEQGLRLLRSMQERQDDRLIARHVAEAGTAVERLRRAVADGERAPVDAPCRDDGATNA